MTLIAITRQQGFTFLEVLAALVIVSIALLATISAMSTATDNSSRLRDKTLAHWVAENRLTEIRIGKIYPELGSSASESVEMGLSEWKWEQSVIATDDENLRRVRISVYKNEEERPTTFLEALIMNPAQSE